jgi:hypothetical protein
MAPTMTCRARMRRAVGMRVPLTSMCQAASMLETMPTAWMPRGYVLIWAWVKESLLYLSQRRKLFWIGKPSMAAQTGDQKKMIQLRRVSLGSGGARSAGRTYKTGDMKTRLKTERGMTLWPSSLMGGRRATAIFLSSAER